MSMWIRIVEIPFLGSAEVVCNNKKNTSCTNTTEVSANKDRFIVLELIQADS